MSKERKEMIKLKDEAYVLCFALGQFRPGLKSSPRTLILQVHSLPFRKLIYLCWYFIVLSPKNYHSLKLFPKLMKQSVHGEGHNMFSFCCCAMPCAIVHPTSAQLPNSTIPSVNQQIYQIGEKKLFFLLCNILEISQSLL